MQPFSITLFATSGDPEGIRHLDKSNWSGYGVVFNKELFHLLKQEGVGVAHCQILAVGVDRAAQITHHQPGGQARGPHEEGEGGGKMLAEAGAAFKEKGVDGIGAQVFIRSERVAEAAPTEKSQAAVDDVPGSLALPESGQRPGPWIAALWQLP